MRKPIKLLNSQKPKCKFESWLAKEGMFQPTNIFENWKLVWHLNHDLWARWKGESQNGLEKIKKILRICLWCVWKHATSSPFPCTSMEIHLWYYTYLWCIQIIPLSMMDIQRILWRWFWWNELQWVGWGYGQQQKYSQYFLVEPLEDQSIYSNN